MNVDENESDFNISSWMSSRNEANDLAISFARSLRAPEFHWFFIQGAQAIQAGLYVSGLSCLLNGVEASIRVTMAQLEQPQWQHDKLTPYRVLSNKLIRQARDAGMPVEHLALPKEKDFDIKLVSEKPNQVDVEIVRLRNNICHGNVLEYVNRDMGEASLFFTPECLRQESAWLLAVCRCWASALGTFRENMFVSIRDQSLTESVG